MCVAGGGDVLFRGGRDELLLLFIVQTRNDSWCLFAVSEKLFSACQEHCKSSGAQLDVG